MTDSMSPYQNNMQEEGNYSTQEQLRQIDAEAEDDAAEENTPEGVL